MPSNRWLVFFFFNDTATTEIYTLSLHDALPIFFLAVVFLAEDLAADLAEVFFAAVFLAVVFLAADFLAVVFLALDLAEDRKSTRLNSSQRQYLVCRLLLEKKTYSIAVQEHEDGG